MACFVAPAAQAVVVSAVRHNLSRRGGRDTAATDRIALWRQRLGWLSTMLWGGSFLLMIEHIWHGEVVPWFPFLTALQNPADIGPMLTEIATVGTTMAVVITAVWAIMVALSSRFESLPGRTAVRVDRPCAC